MVEYIHSGKEPRVIGEFDATKAGEIASERLEVFPAWSFIGSEARRIMAEVSLKLTGLTIGERDRFWKKAVVWAEHVPTVLRETETRHLSDGSVIELPLPENLWHPDAEILNNRTGHSTYKPIPLRIGSSSHPTEIICGDVVFRREIQDIYGYTCYLPTQGQEDIKRALERGDAWIYKPDFSLDGLVVELQSPNLHRRRQSEPEHEYRLVVRQQL